MKDFLCQELQEGDSVVIVEDGRLEPVKHARILGFVKYNAGWFAKIKYMYMYGALVGEKEFPCRYMIKIDPSLCKVKG